ncbi:meiotic nuclear division protein 1 homolog [Protopterus annectens]|uniref:meiotic nuclear division protein 1 homolog n=1 Tax=Protopterus annectens TaxID=7888 RepID=UPI001CF9C059|nr:meiotic nuclear division protein 1 homolog [Protopterus annectens]
MSKKKGLSVEEKRTRMMELFFEKKDVYQLKDLEKIAPKEKGITSMSVKDVLQSLVDDALVDSDRIGTSNYFWAFPSKAIHARKRKLEMLESQLSEGIQKKKILQQNIEKAKVGRQDTEDRADLLKELLALRQQRDQLKADIEKYRDCDPEVVEEIKPKNDEEKKEKWLRCYLDRTKTYRNSDQLLISYEGQSNKIAKEAANRWTGVYFLMRMP